MKYKYDIITFGDMCVDILITGRDVVPEFGQIEKLVDDYLVEIGGSSCLFACQAAKLGLKVGIIGKVGDDEFGQLIIKRLKESGVDTQHIAIDPSLKTSIGIALCQKNDRAILTYMGTISALTPADINKDFTASAKHLHHGSFFLLEGLRSEIPNLFHRAKELGQTTSLDTNWDPAKKWNSTLFKCLPLTDIFMPNEQEALNISRCDNLKDAMKWFLKKGISIVLLKRGANGSELYTNSEILRYKTEPVKGGDSIGAGDSFNAGFLAGWLRNFSIDECLRIANICGRSVAAEYGGFNGQPKWEDVQ
jgi:sugar/nucleoside kinase (ribokinase family)